MNRRLLLFDDDLPAPEKPAFQRHSPTSRAAAEAAAETAATLEARVLAWLREHGPATDLQMMEALGLNVSNGVPRRVALMQRGLVRDSGRRHRNPSGRLAVLWEAVPEGEAPFPAQASPGNPRRQCAMPAPGRPLRRTGEIVEEMHVSRALPDARRRRALAITRRTVRARIAHTVGERISDGRDYHVTVLPLEESEETHTIRLRVRALITLQRWQDCRICEAASRGPAPDECVPFGSSSYMTRTKEYETTGWVFRTYELPDGRTVWLRRE